MVDGSYPNHGFVVDGWWTEMRQYRRFAGGQGMEKFQAVAFWVAVMVAYGAVLSVAAHLVLGPETGIMLAAG